VPWGQCYGLIFGLGPARSFFLELAFISLPPAVARVPHDAPIFINYPKGRVEAQFPWFFQATPLTPRVSEERGPCWPLHFFPSGGDLLQKFDLCRSTPIKRYGPRLGFTLHFVLPLIVRGRVVLNPLLLAVLRVHWKVHSFSSFWCPEPNKRVQINWHLLPRKSFFSQKSSKFMVHTLPSLGCSPILPFFSVARAAWVGVIRGHAS
jgi:hypothetical protein